MRPRHVIFEAKTLLVSGEAMLCRGEVFLVKGSVLGTTQEYQQLSNNTLHLRV